MIEALTLLFFLTALVYSMAGLGGGSTYLALLVLFTIDYEQMRPLALMCNLAVVSYGAWHFYRAGFLPLRRVLPFVVSSIPMAFVGGTINVGKTAFSWLLAVSLAVAAVRMLWSRKPVKVPEKVSVKTLWLIGLPVGAVLGLLAGIVGIGGGIYLAPVLFLLGWADSKQTAAASSFFILTNSVAGLAGQWMEGVEVDVLLMVPLLVAVVAGGQIGSRVGADTLPRHSLQRLTGVLVLAVSGRLLWSLL